MKMTKNFKKYTKRYYQWLCICRITSWILKLSMACDIGVANFVRTWCSTWHGVKPLCKNVLGTGENISKVMGTSSTCWPFCGELNLWEDSWGYLGPLHTRDWEPVSIALQTLSLVGKAEPIQVRFTLRLRDQWSMWMQDGCKVYMDFYMASNVSCFMVTWIVLKNHFLEVGLTQHWMIMALRTFTIVGLYYFYHMWGLAWIKIYWNSIWLRSPMSSHYTWGSVTTLHEFGGVLGRPLDTFFWALTTVMALGSCVKWPLIRHLKNLPISVWEDFCGIISQDPSVSKSNWLHVDIF